MWRCVIAMLWISCAVEEPHRGPPPSAPLVRTVPPVAADPRDAPRRSAHDMLAAHCGECHEGHRSTAQPRALAVFDLDQPDWPARFDERRYQAALMRLTKKPPAAREAFIAFHDAERASPAARAH
jgi:hypothetical protein